LGVDYIKVGLYGIKKSNEAVRLLESVNRAAKEYNPHIKVTAAGYADAKKIGALDPLLIPEISKLSKIDVAMLDTYSKEGKTLFDNLSLKQIKTFVDSSHSLGLEAALAGSLRREDLPLIYDLGADFAGIRGAACSRGNRVSGEITRELVSELVKTIKQAEHSQKRA
jgi:uncharacterized protein (UPF0264 family)